MALPYHEPRGAVFYPMVFLQRDIGNAISFAIKTNAETPL